MLKYTRGKYPFSSLRFILLPETRQGPSPCPGGWHLVPEQIQGGAGAPSPGKWALGIPEVMDNSCRLGKEMPYAHHWKR